jgi:hypothetical protein
MRTTLLLSAATLALAVAGAPIAAHAQATAPQDRTDFNTSGPGQTNAERPTATSSKLGKPASARSRVTPGGTPSTGKHSVEPGHSLDSQSLNTAGPGVSTSTGVNNARSITRPTNTPQAMRAASHPGNGATAGKQPATTATQTAPGFNTGGPEVSNESSPTAPSAKLH